MKKSKKTGSTRILLKASSARHLLNLKTLSTKLFMLILLQKAYASYEKAMQLDPKGTVKKKMLTAQFIIHWLLIFIIREVAGFEAKDYAGALQSFQSQIKLTESDVYVGAVDTGMYYNCRSCSC